MSFRDMFMSIRHMFPKSIDAFDVTNPNHVVAASCFAFALWCLMASWVTGTHSHVDRLWSITPVVYCLSYAYLGEYDTRCVLMAALVTIWGTRLTYNFARKGGYRKGEQDYRWPVLQSLPLLQNRFVWQLFNVSFIAGYQNLLLLLISGGPMMGAYARKGTALDINDAIATFAFLGFLTLERFADNQQWRFQQAKHLVPGYPRDRKRREEYKQGFNTSGLFKFSRHPNFFAEQGVWVSFGLFGVLGLGGGVLGWKNWGKVDGGLGAVLLMLLFQGSTQFTESITLKKYPRYAEYQKVTSVLVPLPPFGKMGNSTKPKKRRD